MTSNSIPSHVHAVVDASYTGEAGGIAGKPAYRTVQAALNAAPEAADRPHIIYIRSGAYYEKLTITKPNIMLLGQERDYTVLTYDAASGTLRPDGTAYGTTGSASLTVKAPQFTAANLTIANGFDYPANLAKSEQDPDRIAHPQAVALKTESGSDQAVFRNCRLEGYQDTLYTGAGRQYFDHCIISGHIDFIFGAGQAVFQSCEMICRARNGEEIEGYITAPSTKLSEEYGLVLIDCRLVKDSPALPDECYSLGRPWHPTTDLPDGTRAADPEAVGAAVYIRCYMDAHIAREGWHSMAGRDKHGETVWFQPQDSRFFEFGSYGPGAHRHENRRQLNEADLQRFTLARIFDGWEPA
ncbi:pectinesterase family protein [Paenibacillus sp. y28]|uniref:pectinesterase family protein n=1 Tax=Paenibacillus sp. y28 TaxID=3129110 RepID=UPI003018C21D